MALTFGSVWHLIEIGHKNVIINSVRYHMNGLRLDTGSKGGVLFSVEENKFGVSLTRTPVIDLVRTRYRTRRSPDCTG